MSDADVDLLVIAGAGGFGREVAWLARNAMPEVDVVLAVTDPKWLDAMASTEVRLLSDLPHDAHFVCAIGDPRGRRSTVEACVNHGLTPTSLIHSSIEDPLSFAIDKYNCIIPKFFQTKISRLRFRFEFCPIQNESVILPKIFESQWSRIIDRRRKIIEYRTQLAESDGGQCNRFLGRRHRW